MTYIEALADNVHHGRMTYTAAIKFMRGYNVRQRVAHKILLEALKKW